MVLWKLPIAIAVEHLALADVRRAVGSAVDVLAHKRPRADVAAFAASIGADQMMIVQPLHARCDVGAGHKIGEPPPPMPCSK